MTSKRKQSITDDQVVKRRNKGKIPAAGSPGIEGLSSAGQDIISPVDGEPEGGGDDDQTLVAPRNLKVISQRIRFAPDGTQYVTVVVEFDEVEGASSYESRVSKL